MPLTRILLYVRNVEETVRFYTALFDFEVLRDDDDRIVELIDPRGGANLMLHPAAKSQKMGQAAVKLVFSVEDVETFCADNAARGLPFGPIHRTVHYAFANAKDPDGNSISVSSRGIRQS